MKIGFLSNSALSNYQNKIYCQDMICRTTHSGNSSTKEYIESILLPTSTNSPNIEKKYIIIFINAN